MKNCIFIALAGLVSLKGFAHCYPTSLGDLRRLATHFEDPHLRPINHEIICYKSVVVWHDKSEGNSQRLPIERKVTFEALIIPSGIDIHSEFLKGVSFHFPGSALSETKPLPCDYAEATATYVGNLRYESEEFLDRIKTEADIRDVCGTIVYGSPQAIEKTGLQTAACKN